MSDAVIVSAVRTAIGTAFKGSLSQTPAEELAEIVLSESVRRSGLDPGQVDDVILAEEMYGGGDLARHAAVAAGMLDVPGQAVNRHCAGGLTAVGNAAGTIAAGMGQAIVAGGVQSSSLSPKLTWRVPGTADEFVERMPPTYPYTEDGPNDDVAITVGWNTAQEVGITREEMDAWALRSHQRAVEAIDAGRFTDEIVPVKIPGPDGWVVEFAVDEHPRRNSSKEKLASLKPLHPEIPGFSITAGNASGVNDGAAALTLASAELVRSEGLTPLARVKAWTAKGVDPRRTGMAAMEVIERLLDRADLRADRVDLWEINEAFATTPIAACRRWGLDESRVNSFGSGCSLGHPVAASGARMLTTLTHELRRRGGGLGVAAMCAGGGQSGAVLIEVEGA